MRHCDDVLSVVRRQYHRKSVLQSWGRREADILWQSLLVVHVVWIFLLSVKVPPTQRTLLIPLKHTHSHWFNNNMRTVELSLPVQLRLQFRFHCTNDWNNENNIQFLSAVMRIQVNCAVTGWPAVEQRPLLQLYWNTWKPADAADDRTDKHHY